MAYRVIIADPAGNITAFVAGYPGGAEARREIAKSIMDDKSLGVEQVGFAMPPKKAGGLWKCEMAGGEFCGNAARSFALWRAREEGLAGKQHVVIEMSGAADPVAVDVDMEAGTACAALPRPLSTDSIEYAGRRFPIVIFEGITHIIDNAKPENATAADRARAEQIFFDMKAFLENAYRFEALGMLFCQANVDAAAGSGAAAEVQMTPLVYVREGGTLIWESSCGSGSAAFSCWLCRGKSDGEFRFRVKQPGGELETAVTKKDGAIRRVTIDGPVRFREVR